MRIVAKDLLPGQTYHLQFRSKNGGDVSEWGHSHSVTIGTESSKPQAPTGVILDSVGDSFQARWNRVTLSDDGSLATDLIGYVVRFRNVNTNQTATFETTDTSFELTFNLNFAMFTPLAGQVGVKVAAKNNMGIQGDWSEEVITQNPPPGPVRNLVAEGVIDAISATWEPPENLEDDFKEYRAFVGATENFTPTTPVWTGVGTSAIYHTSTKVNHWVKVIAYDKFGSGSTAVTSGPVMPRSSVEVDIDAPDTPTNLGGTITGQRLTVTWTAPANPDNDLAGYQIGYRPVGQTGWSYATASHEDTSVVIEPIVRFVNYETKIQAHDFSFNYSPWSSNVTVSGEVNTAPAVPTGLQVKGAITTAMVLWNANTDPDLAGYEVQFKDSPSFSGSDPIFPTTSRVISFVENVTTDTMYYARVRAVDTQGLKSNWSAVASGAVGYVDFTDINDRLDDVITDSVVQYAVNDSETVAPTTGWSTATPTRTPGSYIWFRTVLTYGDGSGATSNPALLTGNDGATGGDGPAGADAYTVLLTNESHDFPGGTSAAIAGSTTSDVVAFKGTTAMPATIGTITGQVNGLTTAITNNGTNSPRVTVTVTTDLTARNGTLLIPVTVDGVTFTKNFSWSVNRTGATGAAGPSVSLAATTQVFTVDAEGAVSPATSVVTGTVSGTTISTWTYSVNGGAFTTTRPSYISAPASNSVTVTASTMTDRTVAIRAAGAISTATDTVTIARVVDGATGQQGIPGQPGADGVQLYTWLKYADTPTSGMSDTADGKTYIGLAYNKPTATESLNYSDYTWSLIRGADGIDGKGISTTVVNYQTHSDGTTPPTGTWSESPTATTTGQFLWTRTYTTYTDGTNSTAYSVSAHGATGDDGAEGRGVTGTTVDYQKHTNGTTAPTGTWTTEIPATAPGEFLWTRTTTTYSSEPLSVVSYSVAKHGETGQQGIPGQPGADGTTTYTWVKYADNTSGLNMNDSPVGRTHIGLAFNKTTATESTVASDYQWSLIQGADGDDGVSITAITPFFRTVATGADAPAQPTGTGNPAGWTTTEPAFVIDTELYRTERITYSNSTATWTPVTKVASYDGINQVNTIAITADKRVRKADGPPVAADGVGAPVGALWYEYGPATSPGTGTVLKQTYEWTGSVWQPRGIDRTFLPAVDIGTGTFGDLHGDRMTANSIGAISIKTEEIAADQAFLNNLVVTTGHISDLTFDKIEGGSGILSDVTVKSTLTLGDASTNGVIQSHGYSASTGFKIDKTGIIINQGSIAASALKIQYGQNLVPPAYADFELHDDFYQNNMALVGSFTPSISLLHKKYSKQSLTLFKTTTGSTQVYFGTSNTDYNIAVEEGKTYILSVWARGTGVTSTLGMRVKWSSGTFSPLNNNTIESSSDWTRYSTTVTVPTGVTGAVVNFVCPTATLLAGWGLDGLQFEEKIGMLDTPSAWSPPSSTSIDGAMIRTGEIRSNHEVPVGGFSPTMVPAWSINMDGGMQIGSAVIRGSLTVGTPSDASSSFIQSSNYVAGVSGFIMRGSDGFAEFQNLLVNLNSTTPGQIIVGTLDQGGQTVITGGAGGGVKFFIPEAESAVAEFGRNVLARNAEGETVASMGDDGAVSGHTGIFENLTVAGMDVTERVTRDDSSVVALDDTGIVTGYGPYTAQTGFREIGFFAEPNRLYRVENWVHVVNEATSSGTFFAYLRYTTSTNPTTAAPAPLVSSDELSSNDGTINTGAEGRFFNTGYLYANSSGQNVRLLIAARGGGSRAFRFVRSRFAVTDLGIYDPLVTSGRFSLGGASGTPAPAPEPPPQLYKKWYDCSWEEVYQITGAADHGSGGLGSKARAGRKGANSNYPWGTMLGISSTMVSDLQGATIKKAGLRMTSLSWMDATVMAGYATASSAPRNMPTTPTGITSIGTLPKGATKTLWLPSSWSSTLRTSGRAIVIGRLDSNGYNDTFIEFANISAASGSRPRFYIEYEK